MIDLRRLTVLRAIAQFGTVTAAAEAAHMTPSAASQQVRALSRELNVPLLEPHGRRVRLTPAARVLLRHADRMAECWEQARADLSHASTDALRGELRLAGMATAVCVLFAPLAAELRTECPHLSVEVREAEPADCFDLVFSGATDLAVVEVTSANPPLTDTRFEQRPLLDEPFDLLVPPGHRLADRSQVELAELARESWIVGPAHSSCNLIVTAACNSAGFTPAVAHQAREWAVVATLVSHGLGVALVPHLAQLPPHLTFQRVSLTGPTRPSRRLMSVVRGGSADHPAISRALKYLGDLAAERGAAVRCAGAGSAGDAAAFADAPGAGQAGVAPSWTGSLEAGAPVVPGSLRAAVR